MAGVNADFAAATAGMDDGDNGKPWNYHSAFLTYNSAHLPKEALKAHLERLTLGRGDLEIMIAHEIGKEEQREHTHVYMRCSGYWRMQSANAPNGTRNYFWPFWFQQDGTWYKPNVQRPRKNAHKNRCRDAKRIIQYLEKEDPAPLTTFDRAAYFETLTVAGAYEMGDLGRLEREVTSLSALESFLRLREGISARRPLEPIPPFRNFLNWDALAISLVARPANDPRTVHWFWSQQGNLGKSKLFNWLNRINPFDILYLDLAVSKDFCALVLAGVQVGFTGRMIVIDMTRSESEWMAAHGSSIYSIVENMKKGVFQNTKFKCVRIQLGVEHPHIVVVANVAPDTRQLSGDRWNIVHLESEHNQRPLRPGWVEQFVNCSYFRTTDCPSVANMRSSVQMAPRWLSDPRVPTDDVPSIEEPLGPQTD